MPATLFRDGELSFDDAVERFLIDCSARGLADKTLFTYRHHFQGMAPQFQNRHAVHSHPSVKTGIQFLSYERRNYYCYP